MNILKPGYLSEHFSYNELACHHCGKYRLDRAFVDILEQMRTEYGGPMIINSWYRCPDYNATLGSGTNGPHTTGRAVDIRIVNTTEAFALLQLALKYGFTGIGVFSPQLSQIKSMLKRGNGYLHIDHLDAAKYPRPRLWTYGA